MLCINLSEYWTSMVMSTVKFKTVTTPDDNLFQFSKDKVLILPKMRCKDYYQLFLEKKDKLPTAKKKHGQKKMK